MSSNQINCVENYAWVDEALEIAWAQVHFQEDYDERNQETFGSAEESVAMEIDEKDDDISAMTEALDNEVYDYEYDDFSVADVADAVAVQEFDEEMQLTAAPDWNRQTTHWVLDDGTVVYNGHADGQRIHDDDDIPPLIHDEDEDEDNYADMPPLIHDEDDEGELVYVNDDLYLLLYDHQMEVEDECSCTEKSQCYYCVGDKCAL